MIEAILGDMCYPKSKALIIPANTKGIMTKGIPARIIKDGLSSISKEAKLITSNNKIEVGGYFTTGPGRLNKRGLKKIYHAVIKVLQSDFTSIYIVRNTLDNIMQKIIEDSQESLAICGLGIEAGNLDQTTIAKITVEICERYEDKIKIKIIDDNVEFIEEAKKHIKRIME